MSWQNELIAELGEFKSLVLKVNIAEEDSAKTKDQFEKWYFNTQKKLEKQVNKKD